MAGVDNRSRGRLWCQTPSSRLLRLSTLVLMTSILCLATLTHAQNEQNIAIHKIMREEFPPGTKIVDVRKNSDFADVSTSQNDLDFNILTEGNPNSRYFAIGKSTGVVTIAQTIDREVVCSFRPNCVLNFKVASRSKYGTFFVLVDFTVEVTDINDNSPEFKPENFELNIPENSLSGRHFQLPAAYDKDTGPSNGVKEYKILEGGEPLFGLETKDSGLNFSDIYLTLLSTVNRETAPSYEVLVGAVDGGQPSLTGTLTVEVKVSDINDNFPQFDQALYDVSIPEDKAIGQTVQEVKASDADSGPNGKLIYKFSELQPQDNVLYFGIRPDTGEIYLMKSLESLTGQNITLVVEASDSGHPPKMSTTRVQVKVMDTVNSMPEILVDTLNKQKGVAEVSEYGEIGKVVAYVSVSDPDSGKNGQTTCEITDGAFTLQKLEENIYKAKLMTRLDREKQDQYKVRVTCQDEGFPRLESVQEFTVKVLDENDNRPVFSRKEYEASMYENNPPGKLVQHLIATDEDIGVNSQLVYEVKGINKQFFAIHDNGTLYAKVSLDREKSDRIIIPVIVTDMGTPALSSAGTVTVNLLDVNDVTPYFEQMTYKFNVPEEKPIGSFVSLVKASDDDLGSNKNLFYHFQEDYTQNDGSFSIDITSGEIKTNKVLDREQKETHNMIVLATDRGTPALTGTASVIITVTDVNDNEPYFLYPSPSNNTLTLPHSFDSGVKIVTIQAVDEDKGLNSDLIYSITSVNESSPFEVSAKSGSMYLGRSLSSDDVGTYTLLLIATDRGPTNEHAHQAPLYVDVFFDNSTLFAAIDSGGTSKAVITTAAVLGVLLLLGIVVLVTFVLYKKHEAKRSKGVPNSASSSSTAKLHGGYYIAPGVRGSTSSFLGKQEDGNANRGHEMGEGMKSTNPYVVMVPTPGSEVDNTPEDPSSYNSFPFLDDQIVEIACNGHHPLNDPNNTTDLDQTDDGPFSTFRSQEDMLSSGFRSGSLNRRNLDNSIAKIPLDGDETSLDSTSDSGRGGSDLENAANKARGATPISLKSGISNRLSPGPREQERTFHTFRGDSPSYPFDSDSDTLTRRMRAGQDSPLPLTSSPMRLPSTSSHHPNESDTDNDLTPRGRPTYPPTMHNIAGIHPNSSFGGGDGRDGSLPRQPIRVAPLPMFTPSYQRHDSETDQSDVGSNPSSLSRRNHVPRLPYYPGIEFSHHAYGGSNRNSIGALSNRSSTTPSEGDNPYNPSAGFVDYNRSFSNADGPPSGTFSYNSTNSQPYSGGIPNNVISELRDPRPVSMDSDFLLPPYPEVEEEEEADGERLSVHAGMTGFSPEQDQERAALFHRSRFESSA